jgi:carbonic anhydrase
VGNRTCINMGIISAKESLNRLREGNQRFVSSIDGREQTLTPMQKIELAREQHPFAIILGCSDSRVPAELVFNQGLGDLFVIRVAGNIVAPSQVGSVEFAASNFGSRLVVVLGHTHCGAIQATIDTLQQNAEIQSPNLGAIIDRIRPSVEGLIESDPGQNRETLVRHAIRVNVNASVDHLRHGSEILNRLIRNEGLVIIGAEYSLETGAVEFFEDGGV